MFDARSKNVILVWSSSGSSICMVIDREPNETAVALYSIAVEPNDNHRDSIPESRFHEEWLRERFWSVLFTHYRVSSLCGVGSDPTLSGESVHSPYYLSVH